jgi:hypothetical protein
MSARNNSARNRKSGLHDNNATWAELNIDYQLIDSKYNRIFFANCQQFYDQEIGYSNVQPGVEISSGSIPLSRSKASIVIIKRNVWFRLLRDAGGGES